MSPSVRWLVVRVTGVVIATEIGLRTIDIQRLAGLMKVPLASETADVPEDRPDELSGLSSGEQTTQLAIRWVLDRWIFPATCLREALVTGWFLRSRQPVLRLGLVGEGNTCHAWVEADGMSFNATEVKAAFVG